MTERFIQTMKMSLRGALLATKQSASAKDCFIPLKCAGLAMTIFIIFQPAVFGAQNVFAQPSDSGAAISLKPGAIELGLAGSMTIVEGSARTTLAARTGVFKSASRGMLGFETELAYSHVNALNWLDWEGLLSWQRALKKTSVYPFVALGGGLRQEHLGSFSQARYPLGLNFGIRALLAPQAAIRVEYKFRRIFHDSAANFSEHHVVVGCSIFFNNHATGSSKPKQ